MQREPGGALGFAAGDEALVLVVVLGLLAVGDRLGLVDRFLHWGLFLDYPLNVYKGDIFSLQYYLVDTAVLLLMGSLGYRVTRTKQMTSQYPWLYRRTSPFTWEERKQESA